MKLQLLLIASLFSCITFSQVIFQKQIQMSASTNSKISKAVAVIETPDGGYIIGGDAKNATGSDRPFILKLNANGDSLWSKSYSYTGFVGAAAKKLFYNKQGNLVLFANVTRQGLGAWAYFFELNVSNGDTIKVSKFQTSNGYVVQDAVQLADLGYAFTTNNANTTSRIYRVNANMTQNWMYQPFPSQLDTVPVNALFNGIVNSGDSLYLSGRLGFGGAVEAYYAKWDINGNKKLFKDYGFGQYLTMNDIELTNQGYALLAGSVQMQTSQFVKTDALAVLKLSLKGDSIDLITFDGPVTDNAYNITKGNGKYLVTGISSEPINGAQVVHVMCLNEAGALLWNQQFQIIPTSVSVPNHYGFQTIETSTGDFVTVGRRDGESPNTSHERVYIIKFKPTSTNVNSIKVRTEKAYVFPNPSNGNIFIKDSNYQEGVLVNVTVTDITGKTVVSHQLNDSFLMPMNISELPVGLYVIAKNGKLIDKVQVVK